MEPVKSVDSFRGRPQDFQLPVPHALQDAMGMNMALITDRVLARGWLPDGFVEGADFRTYRYKAME